MSDLISSQDNGNIPVIAIVGRPNVGKSTIFNRMIGRRLSITDEVPGVTRDPVEAEYFLGDDEVLLIDTGGFKLEISEMDTLVNEKSIAAVKGADLILLVLDVCEVTPEDEAFIKFLRPYGEKLIAVVNKVDNDKREADVWDFYSYGFSEVVGVSAEHGINMDELDELMLKAIDFETAGQSYKKKEPDIRLSILGKPNTGKSTLINRLTETEKSIVSDIPGTTRDVIEGRFDYKDNHFRVLDTAGIRRKKKVEEDVEYYSVNRAIKSIDHADIVFLMIDSVDGLADQDKKIASLIVRKGTGVILVLNKWDKLDPVSNQLEAVTDRTRFLFPILDFAPLLPLSALNGAGIDALLKTSLKVWNQLNMRIDTNRMNKLLKEWLEHYEPPGKFKANYKVKYITQVRSNPVRFLLFVNKKRGFPLSYIQYLTNRIRKDLGFTSVPIAVDLKEK